MSGKDLIEALERTGTGPDKIAAALKYVEEHPAASAEAMTAALEAEGRAKDAHGLKSGWPEGTVVKARKLLAGTPVSDLLGTPPPLSQESKEARLVKEIFRNLREHWVGGHADRQAELAARGVGNPTALRPEGAAPAKAPKGG